EARAAARLEHPNVVSIYDADRAADTHFIAMEFVEGIDLGRLLKQQGPLPPTQACDFVRQAALGLQHAHEQGLVHRDLKPSNLMVGKRSNTVKILDLGLTRLDRRSDEESELPTDIVSKPSTTAGRWDYLAPEQAQNADTADI